MAETHDLSARRWGRSYTITAITGTGGSRLRAAIWATPLPGVGDFLLLKSEGPDSGDGKVRYRIATIERCSDPRDMAFVDLVFAPRPAVQTKNEVSLD